MTQQREVCPVHRHPAEEPATSRPSQQRAGSRLLPALRLAALGLIGAGAAVGGVLGVGWAVSVSPPTAVAIVLGLALLYLGVRIYRHVVRAGDRRSGTARRTHHPGSPRRARAATRSGRPVRAADSERGPRSVDGEVDRAAAEEFIRLFHTEKPEAGPVGPRIAEVMREIDATGTYWHTPAELEFGARVAWRNNARCIGRLYWRSLRVRDLRTTSDAPGVARHCFEHLRTANRDGKIRSVISIFAPETLGRPAPRIWNEQLIRYAGYEQPDGSVLGDPRYRALTSKLIQRGWRPPEPRGAFDVLPLVVETDEEGPRMFEVPSTALHEVPLEHPELDWFADLGMRWHAVPVISNNTLVIGGVSYPAAPFNGWYMGTEIGARNLGDSDRYDLVPAVADRMGLDTSDEANLWRDQAIVEINRAVLHSFRANGVTMTDHHTESRRFLTHVEREEQSGRRCPADWSWIVPPISGSQTPVFHRYFGSEEERVPNFFADDEAVLRALQGEPPAFR